MLSGRGAKHVRESYVGVLSEDIPEELTRCLARLNSEAQPIAGESACGPLAQAQV